MPHERMRPVRDGYRPNHQTYRPFQKPATVWSVLGWLIGTGISALWKMLRYLFKEIVDFGPTNTYTWYGTIVPKDHYTPGDYIRYDPGSPYFKPPKRR